MTKVFYIPSKKGEAGFTLVGLVVSLGIVGIMTAVASQFFSQQMVARRYVETIAMSQGLEGGIATGVVLQLRDSLNTNTPGCINYQHIFQNSQLESDARLRFSETIPVPRSDAIPEDIRQAAQRCRASRKPSNTGNNQQNQFYFCVIFDQDSSARRGSLLNSPLAFAEIYFEMVDQQTSNPLSCQAFLQNKGNDRINFYGGTSLVNFYWLENVSSNRDLTFARSRFFSHVTP